MNIYRSHDAKRKLSDEGFEKVLEFTRKAFELSLHFIAEQEKIQEEETALRKNYGYRKLRQRTEENKIIGTENNRTQARHSILKGTVSAVNLKVLASFTPGRAGSIPPHLQSFAGQQSPPGAITHPPNFRTTQ